MRILYDDTIYNFQRLGGISRYFSEIINRIKKYENAEVSIFNNVKGRFINRFSSALLEVKLRRGNFDIYHPTYYSLNVKRRRCVKTVVTVYDMIHELYLSSIKIHSDSIPIKKKSIMRADHIICISKNTKNDLQRIYNIKDDMISVTYLGGPRECNKPFKDKSLLPAKPYILYVGNRKLPYKNFMTLVKAFYLSKLEADFDLLCFGDSEFSKEEVSVFRKLKLDNVIKYMEGKDEFLQFYYENATVFVYPSLCEGFGIPILEAMAFGCPVIASRATSIPEVAGDAALLFSPDSPEELGSCIWKIINNDALRNEYIEKGRNRCKEFSWDKTALETFNVYKKLIN
jgi:glycosyltransferase involved in cell wall biosynthesis